MRIGFCIFGMSCLLALAAGVDVHAQQPAAENQEEEGFVVLNFPPDMELKILVDYVSQRLGIKILYDEEINNNKVTIQAPGRIPIDSLLGVLHSALKMKNLILMDMEEPGWKQIASSAQMPSFAMTEEAQVAIDRLGNSVAVTQTFPLEQSMVQRVDQMVKTFLTKPGGNSVALPDEGLLIVTDYATNMLKIAKLIEWVTQPKPDVVFEFVPVEHLSASDLSQRLSSLFTARSNVSGGQPGKARGIEVVADERTNQVIVIGTKPQVEEVLALAKTFDVSLGLSTEVYTLKYVSPQRIDELVKNLIDPIVKDRLYKSAIDKDAGMLIVTATPEIHQKVASLTSQLDSTLQESKSPIRFYKLENTTVSEILDTIRAIEGKATGSSVTPTSSSSRYDRGLVPRVGRTSPPGQSLVPGPNRPPAGPGILPSAPPSYREEGRNLDENMNQNQSAEGGSIGSGMEGTLLGDARVIADLVTNSIIVVGDPEVQREYEDLIKRLDRRRPQVMIEIKIVTIDTSDGFSLGVEISGGDRIGLDRLFVFSSFGLNQVEPVTGALSLIPGVGFNGTLLNPETADAVIKSLATHQNARVESAPRILVNDNATGLIESVSEVPFTSVNASQTVSTTSFAGFADAGTTITVTPHISEGNYIQLAFQATLNSFLAAPGSSGIPPPRQTDAIESQVTIPDGYTVIVGGLNRTNYSKRIDGIPFLERIPIVKYAFSSRTRDSSQETLFVFIRPIILKDDQFRDLKFLSGRDANAAGLDPDFPVSKPVLMK